MNESERQRIAATYRVPLHLVPSSVTVCPPYALSEDEEISYREQIRRTYSRFGRAVKFRALQAREARQAGEGSQGIATGATAQKSGGCE